MIPSKKKIIPVRIPKTASIAIQTSLKNAGICYPTNFQHNYASHIQRVVGKGVFNNMYTFGVVRNPWSWLWSSYNFDRNGSNTHKPKRVFGDDFEAHLKWVYNNKLYLKSGTANSGVNMYFHQQRNWLFDKEGNQLVDDIFKFEDLETLFKTIEDKFNVKLYDKFMKGRINITRDKTSYQDVYNNDMIELVSKMYTGDIKAFEYEFEN